MISPNAVLRNHCEARQVLRDSATESLYAGQEQIMFTSPKMSRAFPIWNTPLRVCKHVILEKVKEVGDPESE